MPVPLPSHVPAPVSSQKKETKLSPSTFVSGVFFVLFLLASGTAYYFYTKASAVPVITSPDQKNQEEVARLVAEVGKIMLLPADETPTILSVSDPEQLKNQPFFAHATQGDKVLMYSQAKKAILYNPTEKKIVEVAPLQIGDTAPVQPEPAPAPVAPKKK